LLNEKAAQRREEIGRISRRSPLPPENIRPHWMTEGIEETFDYWNRLAEVWDDLSMGGSGGGDGAMFSHIPETDEALSVLDIGCGTGASWEYILQRAPNAHITGIDLCPAMLDKIRERFQDNLSRFTLIEGSTVDVPFGEACFDFVTSELHIHFFL
jgi:ubiquinone/menaquinone biosynthesis C-methylase UbiE